MSHYLPLRAISSSEEYQAITTRLFSKNHLTQMQLDKQDQDLNRGNFSIKSPQNSLLLAETVLTPKCSDEKIEMLGEKIIQTSSHNMSKGKFKMKVSARDRGIERFRQKFKNYTSDTKRSSSSSRNSSRKSIKSSNFDLSIKESRRPTLESIKNAINNAPDHHIKLVNVDSIERQYIGNFSSNSIGILNPHVAERSIEKQDLQTQTSLLLEKLLLLPPN